MLDALSSPAAVTVPGDQHGYDFSPTNWTLAKIAEDILRDTFARRGHRPSEAHWQSLREVLETIQAMADGVAEPRIHLAGLSPGLGKTSAIIAAMIAMRDVGIYAETGTVVCVGRVKEAFDLAKNLAEVGLGHQTAILLSDREVSELRRKMAEEGVRGVVAVTGGPEDAAGSQTAQSRAILITSQQRVYKATQHRGFKEITSFGFQGRPRDVVIWDEAVAISADWTVPTRSLHDLVNAAYVTDSRFEAALLRFMADLAAAKHDTLVDVPDWTDAFGITDTELNDALVDRGASERATALSVATALFAVGGRSVRVFHNRQPEEQGGGNTVVSFTEALPADLNPLVLDASVLVRPFYDNLVEHRGAVRLTPAQQHYGPLRCHLWTRGGGKKSFRRHGPAIIEGIVKTILNESRTAPDHNWLVVHHKSKTIGYRRTDGFPQEVLKELPEAIRERVSFVTWGSHCGVNDYQDCQRVILAGTLFLPEPAVAAMTHASKNRPLDRHAFEPAEELKKVRDGQHRDGILQAGLRGCARQSEGGACKAMDLYIVGSISSGIPAQVPLIFPGCQVLKWCPVEPPMRGKVLDAANIVDGFLADGRFDLERPVTTGHIAERMPGKPGKPSGMRLDLFTRDVSSKEAWTDFLASRELCEVPGVSVRGKAARVLKRLADDVEVGQED